MNNGGKTAKAAKNDEKRQKTLEKRQKMLEKRRNGKKLWKTAKIILGAASKFFLALFTMGKRPFESNAALMRTHLKAFADLWVVILIKIPKGL